MLAFQKRPAACSCSEEALCGCIFTGKDLSRKNGDSMFFLSYKVGKIKHWIKKGNTVKKRSLFNLRSAYTY